MKMKIGRLAELTQTKIPTIRYYEQERLLAEPERTEGNYRLYGEKDVERLRFIRHCRRHGITIPEIRALLEYRNAPETDCSWVNDMVDGHISSLGEQIASLEALRGYLQALRSSCMTPTPGQKCGIVSCLEQAGQGPCPGQTSEHTL